MFEKPHELPPAEEWIIEVLADEYLRASCVVVLVDQRTWAIRGSLAYEGEVILAVFDTRDEAELALARLATLAPDISVR